MISKKQRDTIAKMMDFEWEGVSLEMQNFKCSYSIAGFLRIEVNGEPHSPASVTIGDINTCELEASRRRLVQYLYGYRVLKDMVCRLGLYWERNAEGKHYVGNN